jgi:hypothetical protein
LEFHAFMVVRPDARPAAGAIRITDDYLIELSGSYVDHPDGSLVARVQDGRWVRIDHFRLRLLGDSKHPSPQCWLEGHRTAAGTVETDLRRVDACETIHQAHRVLDGAVLVTDLIRRGVLAEPRTPFLTDFAEKVRSIKDPSRRTAGRVAGLLGLQRQSLYGRLKHYDLPAFAVLRDQILQGDFPV